MDPRFSCFILVLLAVLESGVANENNTCNGLRSLAKILTSNDGNMQNLTKVFYPSRRPSAKILKVTYYFEDEMGKRDNCNVTYFWASGAFLLIQPPSIFQFTSLFFNHKVAGEETSLILTLPSACRHLVLRNATCSCNESNEGILDLLTHQLKLYAKYMDISKVEQDDSDLSIAICDDEVDSTYYLLDKTHYQIYLFLIVLLVLPMVSIALTATVVRSLRRSIHASIVRRSGHHNMTGIVLTGTFVTFFIVGCDVAAVYYAFTNDHILRDHVMLKTTLNFISTAILLVYDLLVTLLPIAVLLILCCKHIHEYSLANAQDLYDEESAGDTNGQNEPGPCPDGCMSCFKECKECVGGSCNCKSCCREFSKCCMTCFLPQCLILGFYAIFGKLEQDPLWEETREKKITNSRVAWIVTLLLIAPFFTISSHFGFILVSWLTDSAQASSVALICLAVMIYMFFMLRQCYLANEEVNPKGCCGSTCTVLYPCYQILKYMRAFFYIMCFCNRLCRACSWCMCVPYTRLRQDDLMDFFNHRAEPQPKIKLDHKDEFNTKAFCIVFCWGWILVVFAGMIIFAFSVLPFVTTDLISKVFDTFQVLIILVSLLITYKILSLGKPAIARFLQQVRDAYITLQSGANGERRIDEDIGNRKDLDDYEAAGCLVAELAEVVVHKLPRSQQPSDNTH